MTIALRQDLSQEVHKLELKLEQISYQINMLKWTFCIVIAGIASLILKAYF
jgi:hypothetical protein